MIKNISTILCSILLLCFPFIVSSQEPQTNIIPGKRMDTVELGTLCSLIHKEELHFSIQDMRCDAQGHLVAIESNSGGSLYFNTMTVGGANAPRIIQLMGLTFRPVYSEALERVVAYYLWYDELGIAFRVVYIDGGDIDLQSSRSILQAIRIFVPGRGGDSSRE